MPERVQDASTLPADELREVRPPVDRLGMEAVRERAEKTLFGSAAPARFGRYVLLGDSADGGMGIVYAAYDPELHRKVALKVLHPRRQADARAHERLIVEARALARLDHPNVVKVHDVITHDEQVVIVMAWIEGDTLAAWEHERPRSWREVVAVYAQAGEGLAAAHGVGVIHRDFKPSNAIVGDDGRVRVLDFGLARAAQLDDAAAAGASTAPVARGSAPPVDALLPAVEPDEPLSISASWSDPGTWAGGLTAPGDVVGTLAYAAPEQIAGLMVTPASDQFSFAVSLHRALEGVAPFDGRSPGELAASIRSGRIALGDDGRSVPAWLRAIVSRGLAADPAQRFPSMSAMLAELERPRGWRRWRVPLLVAACLAIAAAALVVRPASDPFAGCDAGSPEVAAAWSDGLAARLGARLDAAIVAPDASQAGESRDRVLRGLDQYRAELATQHRAACRANRSGDESDTLLDLHMACLRRRLGDFRATLAVIEHLGTASSDQVVNIVARMPRVSDCADGERLQAEAAPSRVSGTASSAPGSCRTAAVRAQISQAMALDRAGQSRDAIATATAALGAAEHTGEPSLVTDAALTQGRILLANREPARAQIALARARAVAFENGRFAAGVEAAARELYLTRDGADVEAVRRLAGVLVPLSTWLPGDHFAGPLLLNNIGTVYMAARDRPEATRYFQLAHDALDAPSAFTPDLELANIDMNLAMVTPGDAAREELARGVWQRFHSKLGESHLETLTALDLYARFVRAPDRAHELLAAACSRLAAYHPERVGQRVYCESYCAFLAGELGDRAEALQRYEAIAALEPSAGDDDDARVRIALARGYARLLRGEPAAAKAELGALVRTARQDRWWERARLASAEVGIGLAERALGHAAAAARHLEAAVAPYREAIEMNEQVEYRARLAAVQRALATVR